MQEIVKAFWKIALFRSGPQDLPDSKPLLLLALALYAVTDGLIFASSELGRQAMGIESLSPGAPPMSVRMVLATVADIALVSVCFVVTLFYFNFAGRIRQTLTAAFGSIALLQILTWPAFLLLFSDGMEAAWPVVFIVLVLVLLWSVAIYAHIVAQAISRSFGVGVALATLYFFIDYQLFQLLPEF